MNDQSPLVFVCVTRKNGTVDWPAAHSRYQFLYTTIPDVVLASVRRSNGPGTREINAVIFDQSIGARAYLDFISEVGCEFRGDVLLIAGDGSGILSTVSPREGRYIYPLDQDDVHFYAAARFGIENPVEVLDDDNHYRHAMTA